MKRIAPLLLLAAALGAQDKTPNVAFVYPAGGQAGSTVDVVAGGQNIFKPRSVHVSGRGVEVEVVDSINGHSKMLREYFKGLRKYQRTGDLDDVMGAMDGKNAEKTQTFPGYRALVELEKEEFAQVANKFYRKESKQRNRHLDTRVHLRIRIAPDAPPGDREIRFLSWAGWSAPIRFQVGSLPELNELEPNDVSVPSESAPHQPPFTINGQVMPGDVDRMRFHASAAQTLIVRVEARSLVPYLADAVPGWFQPVVTVYDSKGREIAFADDFRFDPDPVLIFQAPEDGDYELQIQDSIFRGREDFVYRIAVSEDPFVSHIYPLGATGQEYAEVRLFGWNLPAENLALPKREPDGTFAQGLLRWKDANPSLIHYTRDQMPEVSEEEDHETHLNGRLPRAVNGRITTPGEVDRIHFNARTGDVLVADLVARRLRSPLDAMLRLFDAHGNLLSWNDDAGRPRQGLLTHDADPRLEFEVYEDGEYVLEISDVQGNGSSAHAYRLRLGPPQPDFTVQSYPSAVNLAVGQAVPVTFRVDRKDGFEGPIEIKLEDTLPGLELRGGPIPAGCNKITMTLHAPERVRPTTKPLKFVASAVCDGIPRTRVASPTDAVTQAFILNEFVSAQSSMVNVFYRGKPGKKSNKRDPFRAQIRLDYRRTDKAFVPAGGLLSLDIRGIAVPTGGTVYFELADAPDGVRLLPYDAGSKTLILEADESAPIGEQANLVVLASIEVPSENAKRPAARRLQLGAFPALPCSVVSNH